MADVFVSYRRDDQQSVEWIVYALRDAGLTVWWDRDIPAGAPWEATIEQELNGARTVLVAWSRAAVESENVRAEARRAKQAGKLVQVFVESCEPPLFFGEQQGVDLVGWRGDGADTRFHQLLAGIRGSPNGLAGATKAVARKPRLGLLAAVLVAIGALGGLTFLMRGDGANQATLARLEGTWGRPGCPAPQRFSVHDGRITVNAEGWNSVGHVVSINGDIILSETLTPLSERGRLVELRVDGDNLVIHDRTTDVQQVLERCS